MAILSTWLAFGQPFTTLSAIVLLSALAMRKRRKKTGKKRIKIKIVLSF